MLRRTALGSVLAGCVLAVAAKAQDGSETWRFDRLEKIGGHETKVEGQPRLIDTPFGKAVEFDGVDDALFIENHPLAGAETFTWETIFRPDSNGEAEQRFFHMQENGSQTRLLFETRLTGGNWYLDSFANTPAGSKPLIDRNLVHPLDRWYHVAMAYDGKMFRHYVNGVMQGEAEVKLSAQGPGRTSVGVRINRVDYFKGAVRLARMTRRALPVSEFLKPDAK
jgi:hypothetical protein